MSTATLTSKGQITVPKSVRDQLGLETGDRIEFVETEAGAFSIIPATRDVKALKGIVSAKKAVSIEEMQQAVRRRAAQK